MWLLDSCFRRNDAGSSIVKPFQGHYTRWYHCWEPVKKDFTRPANLQALPQKMKQRKMEVSHAKVPNSGLLHC